MTIKGSADNNAAKAKRGKFEVVLGFGSLKPLVNHTRTSLFLGLIFPVVSLVEWNSNIFKSKNCITTSHIQ